MADPYRDKSLATAERKDWRLRARVEATYFFRGLWRVVIVIVAFATIPVWVPLFLIRGLGIDDDDDNSSDNIDDSMGHF